MPCRVSPVRLSMPTGVVIMLVLLKFMDAISLLYTEDSISQEVSRSSGPYNLSVPSPFNDLFLALEYRGCIASLSVGLGRPMFTHSVKFDQLWISVVVSISSKRKLP